MSRHTSPARMSRGEGRIPFGSLVATACIVVASASAAGAQEPDAVLCAKCHSNREFLVGKAPTPAGEAALYVPDSLLRKSRHSSLDCAECHPGYDAGYPHRPSARTTDCQSCHEETAAEWAASIHAENVAGRGDAPGCVSCHGSHAVFGADDRRSPTHPLNVAELCGSCHADPRIIGTYFSTAEEGGARTAVRRYYETVHGAALTGAGLVVTATCNDCHGAHRVLPADSTESTVHDSNVAETCGACHQGVLEVYEGSAHGESLRAALSERGRERRKAPVCVDCHTSHEIVRADEPQWFLGVVEECGSCHQRLYDTYFETYHGKATALGYQLAAQCSECHTSHDMRPVTDPASSVHPANRVETCGQCHAGANENFVKYLAHGDPRDRENYPQLFWPWLFMTTLLAGVFGFFGTHTLLWLGRVAINRMRGGGPAGSGRVERVEP